MTWYLLIHQLPPRPLYLRAKIRNRLTRVGALAVKNSVYVLPAREDCLEDMQWIAQEAANGGGEAFVCQADFVSGVSNEQLVQQFQSQAGSVYQALKDEARQPQRDPAGTLARLRRRLDEAIATDFFNHPARKEVENMLRSLEKKIQGRKQGSPGKVAKHKELMGRIWVTRRGIKVDRMASAWLVLRFVDPRSRFRFIDPKSAAKRAGEIGFDMVGGEFTHDGERCTFETLLARLGFDDAALRAIAEIVHDVDLKDGKFGRPDTQGVQRLIQGIVERHPDDTERLSRGCALFDDLYASFGGKATLTPSASQPRGQRARRGG